MLRWFDTGMEHLLKSSKLTVDKMTQFSVFAKGQFPGCSPSDVSCVEKGLGTKARVRSADTL